MAFGLKLTAFACDCLFEVMNIPPLIARLILERRYRLTFHWDHALKVPGASNPNYGSKVKKNHQSLF